MSLDLADAEAVNKATRQFHMLRRWDEARKRAPRYRGYVATAKGPVHWSRSPLAGQRVDDPYVPRRTETVPVEWDLPTVRRRTPDERIADVAGRIYDEAIASFRATGKVVLARSVMREIVSESWRWGTPMTLADLDTMVESQIMPLCRNYAAALLDRCQRKYRANDRHVLTPEIRTGG